MDEQPETPPRRSRRRLQRAPDFTGERIDRFRQVCVRHFLPVLLCGALLLAMPGGLNLLGEGWQPTREQAGRALIACLAATSLILGYGVFLDRRLSWQRIGWMGYLLLVSAWEEWTFRLALPALLDDQGLTFRAAVIASNFLFGAMHYFTLRWRLEWCVMAGLGGLWFSFRYHQDGDFLAIVLLHWVMTYLNTPREPMPRRPDGISPAAE